MRKIRLCEVAGIAISNVDKKTHPNQKKVRLCNYVDVYHNWAITSDMLNSLMEATANENELKRFRLQCGDIALTKDSETKDDIGKAAYIADNFDDVVLGYHCALIRPDKELLDGKYLNALLHTNYACKYFELSAGGSGQRFYLGVDALNNFPIMLPSMETQRKIGNFFSTIDKKIELNKRINDNLSQQMKTIYDYWFVQYDFPDDNGNPYCSSGGEMVWNEQLRRKIPKDWEVKSLAQLMKKNGCAFDFSSEQPTIDLSVMPSDSVVLSRLNSSSNFTTNLYMMKYGDILFGSIRPYLHKAGFAPCDGVVAGTVHSFHVLNASDYNFVLFTICQNTFFNYAVNSSTGTKMPVVSSDAILDYKIAYSPAIVKKFNEVSFVDVVSTKVQENIQLKNLRDWLLLILMNGQAIIMD